MKIEPGTIWRHTSGRIYTVMLVANTGAADSRANGYPHTVVYQGENGFVWAKTKRRFLETMTPVVKDSLEAPE